MVITIIMYKAQSMFSKNQESFPTIPDLGAWIASDDRNDSPLSKNNRNYRNSVTMSISLKSKSTMSTRQG